MKCTAAVAAALLVMTGCHVHRSTSGPASRSPDLRGVVEGAHRSPFQRLLAVNLAKRGRCSAAIYHWRQAMRYPSGPNKKRPNILAVCLKKLIPTAPERPAGMGQAPLWRALKTQRVFLSAGLSFYGSNDAQKAWTLSNCRNKGQCTVDRWPWLEALNGPAFSIGRTEVTIEKWNRCVRAGVCSPLHRGPWRFPVTGIDMQQAEKYCRWTGGRLPTEQEWERAGRSMTNPADIWPWGNAWIPGCARIEQAEDQGPADVGTYPCDLSDSGVADMAGNVAEWIRPSDAESKRGMGLVKGGSWSDPRWRAALFARIVVARDRKDSHLGFRCVWPEPLKTRRRN